MGNVDLKDYVLAYMWLNFSKGVPRMKYLFSIFILLLCTGSVFANDLKVKCKVSSYGKDNNQGWKNYPDQELILEISEERKMIKKTDHLKFSWNYVIFKNDSTHLYAATNPNGGSFGFIVYEKQNRSYTQMTTSGKYGMTILYGPCQ